MFAEDSPSRVLFALSVLHALDNTSPLAGALEGTFIAFKRDRYPEGPPIEGWLKAGKAFLRNYRLSKFRKYFSAPQKLSATHFYIPPLTAEQPPAPTV